MVLVGKFPWPSPNHAFTLPPVKTVEPSLQQDQNTKSRFPSASRSPASALSAQACGSRKHSCPATSSEYVFAGDRNSPLPFPKASCTELPMETNASRFPSLLKSPSASESIPSVGPPAAVEGTKLNSKGAWNVPSPFPGSTEI